MSGILKTNHWITALVITVLCGCSSVKVRERHLDTDRSTYYPLAVISATSAPKLNIEAFDNNYFGGPNAYKSNCVAKSFVLFSFVCIGPAAIMDSNRTAHNDELQEQFENKTKTLQPRSILPDLVNQHMLRNNVMEYLAKRNVIAQEVNINAPPPYSPPPDYTEEIDFTENTFTTVNESDSDYIESYMAESYQTLYRQGFKKILILSLLSVDFNGRYMGIDGKRTYALCLEMRIQGNVVDHFSAIHSDYTCKPLQEWLPEGVLKSEVSRLYTTLSASLLDNLFFIYGMPQDNSVGLSPITPKLLLEETFLYEEQVDWAEPEYKKDIKSFTGILFTDVDIRPRFEWTVLEGHGITDVRYDIRIFKGTHDMSLGRGDYSPLYHFVRPDEVVYSRDNLAQTTHDLDISLEPCSWYFWTVRANFQLFASPRVTYWSKAAKIRHTLQSHFPFSYFPIRTVAAEGSLNCWEQTLD